MEGQDMCEINASSFCELSNEEMIATDGGMGVVATAIIIGVCCTGAGFGIGYGLARWLG